MKQDVVAEDLVEDSPALKLPIQHLVMQPYPPLHCSLLLRIAAFCGHCI